MVRTTVLLLIIFCSFINLSNAAEINIINPTQVNIPAGAQIISIQGEIVDNDYKKFTDVLKTIPNATNVTVLLSGPGGTLVEGILIGKTIKMLKYKTLAVGICASACAYTWLAGREKGVHPDANIGFHGVYTLNDDKTAETSAAGNALLGVYISELGYSYDLVLYATSSELNMTWLIAEDARKLGINFISVNNKESMVVFLHK